MYALNLCVDSKINLNTQVGSKVTPLKLNLIKVSNVPLEALKNVSFSKQVEKRSLWIRLPRRKYIKGFSASQTGLTLVWEYTEF